MLVSVAEPGQKVYGDRYLLNTDNVLYHIQIFGLHMTKFFPNQDI